MTNLFSIFDPVANLGVSLNWITSIYILVFIPSMFWIFPSKHNFIWLNMLFFLKKEMNMILSNINFINILIFISLFVFIFLNNFISLFPYIFPVSSHLCFSLTLAMIMWMSFMLYGWMVNSDHMFTHLTPQGTPTALMFFMVLIETISNIIRPITLSVRLSANIIAGHLLMTLISSSESNLKLMSTTFMILSQTFLVVLEVAVSFIQAYVFSVLSSLYSVETN